MKKNLFFALFGLLLVSTSAYAATNSNGQPFDSIIAKISQLEEKIANIQLIPGPRGPQGTPAQFGTSTIAFLGESHADCDVHPSFFDGNNTAVLTPFYGFSPTIVDGFNPHCRTVLKTDGTIWKWNNVSNTWARTGSTTPIAVSEVVIWQNYMILDKNGDVWVWDDSLRTDDKWVNIGHP